MSKIKPAGLMSAAGIAGSMLLLVFGLAACLGGGGDSGTEVALVVGTEADEAPPIGVPLPPAGFPTPPAIPLAPTTAGIVQSPSTPGIIRVTNADTTGMVDGSGVAIATASGV